MKKLFTGYWSPSRKRGFTLTEILVAVTILAIAVAAIYTSFKGGLTSWTRGTARMERYLNARAALDMMSREIACALINTADLSLYYCQGWNDDDPSSPKNTQSSKDEFFFTAAREDGACEMGYWLRDSDNSLMRVYVTPGASTYDGLCQSGDSSSQLALPVTDLQFKYFDGTSWEDTWDSKSGGQAGKLPEAVKITIETLDETADADTQIFSTIVYLPTSR